MNSPFPNNTGTSNVLNSYAWTKNGHPVLDESACDIGSSAAYFRAVRRADDANEFLVGGGFNCRERDAGENA